MSHLEFWYDLASNYSYLAAMRIEGMAAPAGVDVVWRPFLLGPIFKAQGWSTSPFNLYPVKGRAMIRDMQRICADRGLPFVMPEPFPAHSLLAVRIAHLGEGEGWCARFSKAAFAAEFGEGRNVGDIATLTAILDGLGLDAASVIARAGSEPVKEGLKARTAEAQARGIFGAPTFIVQMGSDPRAQTGRSEPQLGDRRADPIEELFWGDDRLEQAIRWALA